MTNPMTTVPSEKDINIIRGKNLVGAATKDDVDALFAYIDALEMGLDVADQEDTFGPSGWRDHFGVAP